MDYKVSVIVPIYNVEPYIKRALDSLANQTLKEIEVILVDDGSTDNSGNIADDYARKYDNFTIIHKTNGGLSDARNAGMKAAHAPYIGFIDPDDYAETDMFEQLWLSANTNCSDLVLCSYYEEFTKDNIEERKIALSDESNNGETLIESFIRGDFGAYAWNKLYSTEIINRYALRFPKGIQLVEDTVFLCEYLKYINTFSVVDACLYHYIRNSNSICAKYHKRQFEYYREAYRATQSLVDDCGRDKQALHQINDIKYLKTCLNVLDQMHSFGNKDSLPKRREAMLLAIEDERFQALLEQYGLSLEGKDYQKKYKYIARHQTNRLMFYEWWKMRVIARVKYYLG